MITARGWGTHHLRQSGMGGGGRGRYHHLKDDFRRRMVALLGFERSGGEECGGEVVFKYERKRRSGHKVDLRRGGGSGTRGGKVVVAAARDVVVTGGGGGGDKVCADCKTTRTPLWRTGPCGPKSLCNACGIRYRKMRRKGGNNQSNSKSSSSNIRPSSFGISPSESEMLKQKQRRQQEGLWLLLQQSRKFASTCGKEEAEAAVLLMALSTGLFVHS